MYIPALRRLLVLCLGLPMAATLVASAAMGQVSPVAMRTPALPSGALDLGPLPRSQAMQLTLYLAPTPERQAALESYLTAVQTPGNAAYHTWLTPAEFGQRFGATADQIAAVSAFAQAKGLTVESATASGLRVVVSGTAANVEAAMSPALHGVQLGQTAYYANRVAPVLPNTMVGNLLTVEGLSDLPATYPLTLATDSAAASATADGLTALSAAVEANTARVVSLNTASCLEDVDAASQAAMRLTLQQASVQGMTVLAQTGCGPRGSAGFPSILAEVTSVAPAPGITTPTTANLTELRPAWQQAMGLPADGLRHEPDLTTTSLSALAQTMLSILAQQPAASDGTSARLGNVNATFYQLAAEPDLYTQPDHAAAGTWEAATGLGVVDLDKLDKFFPHGSLSDNVSINVSNGGFVAHGGSFTFSSTVTDTSGQGNGVTPSGTVTFSTNTGVTLGSNTLLGGTAAVSYNQLPGGSYTVTAAYSGDGTYAANNSISTGFSVGAETVNISGNLAGAAAVGTMATVDVIVTAPSGVGSPTGTVTVTPQGTSDTSTYTGTLAGTGATTTASVQVPAVQGGSVTFLAQCTTTASFSCSNPGKITGSNNLGTPTVKLTASPLPPVNGTTTVFNVTVSGAGGKYPTPAGNITFEDNGTSIGSATLSGGTASFSESNWSAGSHSLSAVYGGDNNYVTETASANANTAATATTTALAVSPNPPVSGSTTTLTATITYTLTNGVAPTGTMNFFEDGAQIGSGTVSAGVATFSSTTLSSTTAHSFDAIYVGDSNYLTSTSPAVASAATGTVATTTTLNVLPNPPVSGSTTTLTATIAQTGSSSSPTGTVTFYEDSVSIGTGAVSGGVATLTSTALSSTVSHAFVAVYGGDTTFKTSTSPVFTTAASTATVTTSTVLSVLPNPPVSGTLTTLTATITYTGTTAPTGTISFYEDAALLQSQPVSNASASISSTTLSSKTAHAFSAVYSGDSTFKPSTAPTVNTAATTTTATTVMVSASASTVAAGGTVTLSATVTPSSVVNSTAPTGTVTFSSAQGILCSGAVSSNAASCAATLTTTGVQAISATYNGDSNYTASTSTTAANVTVGSTTAAGVLIAAASPASTTYGNTVTLTSTLTPTTAVTGGPAGSVTFALTGTVASSATVALVSNGSTSATATSTIVTPVPGTYVVTATCTSTNVTCTGLSATASLTVIKGNTVTTLVASPTSPMAGETTTLTATVAPSIAPNGAAILPTGTVTFFVNGTPTVETLTNGVALFSTVLTATTGNFVTAVYSGDTNWNGSNSSQLDVTIAPIPTTGTLSANQASALYTANIVLTDTVLVPATATVPYPAGPTGSVTFYDLYNGQTVLLGTSNLTSLVVDSVAQISTTGLMKGTHTITALFNGGTVFAANTSTFVVNITDYAVSFSPQTLELSRGSGGASVATITAENGFGGQVVLGCTPPPGALMTCNFTPAVITGSGTSVLSVTTTAATAYGARPAPLGRAATGISLAAVSLGTLLLGLLLPGTRRRPTFLLAIVAAAVIGLSMGCTTQGIVNTTGTTGTNAGGTPQGTQLLSITTQGTDGVTTVRHNSQFQVTIQ